MSSHPFEQLDVDSASGRLLEQDSSWPDNTSTLVVDNRVRSAPSILSEEDEEWSDVPTPVPLRPNYRDDGEWFSKAQDRSQATSGDGLKHSAFRVFARRNIDHASTPNTRPAETILGLSIAALRRLGLSMHLSLFMMHVALIGVFAHHLEQRVFTAYSEDSKLPTVLSVSLQAFYTLYTAVLVTITQRLGLIRTLYRQQKLTALADASSAWSGLGSALIGLWNNIRTPSSPLPAMVITVYLTSTMVLHVVSSSIMSFQPYNQTVTTTLPTWIAWPSPSASLWEQDGLTTNDWEMVTGNMPDEVLQVFTASRQGINGTTIYDTLQPNSLVGTARVNATTIGFECGLVPNVSVVGSGFEWHNYSWSYENLTTMWTDVVLFNPQMTEVLLWTGRNSSADTFYTITTALASGSSQTLNDTFGVPTNFTHFSVGEQASNPYNVTVQIFFVGCSMNFAHGIVEVDVQTNIMQGRLPIATIPSSREWQGFPINGSYLGSVGDESNNVYEWLVNALSSAPGANIDIELPLGSEIAASAPVSNIDYYVMQKLGINVTSVDPLMLPPDPTISLNLTDFENVLATAAAEMLWTACVVAQDGYEPETGVAKTTYFQLVWRLNINLIPLLFGLCASLIILVLATFLVGWRGHDEPAVSSLGMLEIMWLAEHEPTLRCRFRNVDRPTTDKLRAAAMFDVCLSEEFAEFRRPMTSME